MKRKNYIVLFFCLLLGITSLKAQYFPKNLPNYDAKQWHFGFSLGMNTMNFDIRPIEIGSYDSNLLVIQPSMSQGFNIGIVANKKILKYLDVRFVPTLSFGQRNLEYTIRTGLTEEQTYNKTVESTFLDLPLSLKYKSKRFNKKFNNMRTYVLAGARYSLDLASQKKKKGNTDEVILKLNPHDFMLTTGFGFDFYLPYFKFGIELQMAYGIVNVLDHDGTIFTTNVDKLTSKMGWITFTFE